MQLIRSVLCAVVAVQRHQRPPLKSKYTKIHCSSSEEPQILSECLIPYLVGVFLKAVLKLELCATVVAGKQAAAIVATASAATKPPRKELYQRLFLPVLYWLRSCRIDTDIGFGVRSLQFSGTLCIEPLPKN